VRKRPIANLDEYPYLNNKKEKMGYSGKNEYYLIVSPWRDRPLHNSGKKERKESKKKIAEKR